MRRPTSCTNEGEHPARFRVWLRNGGPESVPSTFNCFVPMIDWERLWRKFEERNGHREVVGLEPDSRPSLLPVPIYASRFMTRTIVCIVNNAINDRC